MFKSFQMAGFECASVNGGEHDLLASTYHQPDQRMGMHYDLVKEHGITTVRDALTPGTNLWARLTTAKEKKMEVIWDLNHYHSPMMPDKMASDIGKFCEHYLSKQDLWVCPVNEPSLYPLMCDIGINTAIVRAWDSLEAIFQRFPKVKVMINDPVNGAGDQEYKALDTMVNAYRPKVVGVNYYPHTKVIPLSEVLVNTHKRYKLPVMVSETSFHDGFHNRFMTKGLWHKYVMDEIKIAQNEGAEVVGCCWYPIIDSPPWEDKTNPNRWSHGLIRGDLSIDPSLSQALKAAM